MSGISTSPNWFSERPQWLQIAATRLLQRSELTDKEVSEPSPVELPKSDDLLADMNSSKNWREEYAKRPGLSGDWVAV